MHISVSKDDDASSDTDIDESRTSAARIDIQQEDADSE